MTKALLWSTAIASWLTLTVCAQVARADALAPDETSCQGTAVGTACKAAGGAAGTCQNAKCRRASYDQNPDGGAPLLGSKEVDCVTCLAGSASPASDGGVAPSSGSSDGGCSVAASDARGLAPFALAAAVAALVGRFGRRKRA